MGSAFVPANQASLSSSLSSSGGRLSSAVVRQGAAPPPVAVPSAPPLPLVAEDQFVASAPASPAPVEPCPCGPPLSPKEQATQNAIAHIDTILDNPQLNSLNAFFQGTAEGTKAGLMMAVPVFLTTLGLRALKPNWHMALPGEEHLLKVTKGLPTSAKQAMGLFGLCTAFTVGISSLVFGGAIGSLEAEGARSKLQDIKNRLQGHHYKNNNWIDKLSAHFLPHLNEKEDPLAVYQKTCKEVEDPKDAAVNGLEIAVILKLLTLAPKVLLGVAGAYGVGLAQAAREYHAIQKDPTKALKVGGAFGVKEALHTQAEWEAASLQSGLHFKKALAQTEEAHALAKGKQFGAFLKKRLPQTDVVGWIHHQLGHLHLGHPAMWLNFLVVPSLVAVGLVPWFRAQMNQNPKEP